MEPQNQTPPFQPGPQTQPEAPVMNTNATQPVPPTPPMQPMSPAGPINPPVTQKKSNNKIIIGVICAVFGLLFLSGLFSLMGNNVALEPIEATFVGDGYELKYDANQWSEVSVSKTDGGTGTALRFSATGTTLVPIATSSLDEPFDTYSDQQAIYDAFYDKWSNQDDRFTLYSGQGFTEIKDDIYLAQMNYTFSNTGREGRFYLLVSKTANAVSSFMSDAIDQKDVETFNTAARVVLDSIQFNVLYDDEMSELMDGLSAWNKYSKNSSDELGQNMNITGTWRVLSESGQAIWTFKNGEFWWYKDSSDLEDNYWYGKVDIVNGKEGLGRVGIDENNVSRMQQYSDGKVSEDNIYAMIFTPQKIISGGEDKSSTNITGEDWHFVWVLVDHGADGIEAQALNTKTYDTSYYIKIAD